MGKITTLAVLGLAFTSAVTTMAQGIPTGHTETIVINKTTGTKYRSNGEIQPNAGAVAKWVSTAMPNFSLTYAGGTVNQMQILDTYANLAWNNNNTDVYAFTLSGDDAVRYRIKSYTVTSTAGKLITVNAPTPVNHTFSATSNTVTVDYGTAGVAQATFRNGLRESNTVTNHYVDATISVTLEEMKTKEVVYVVKSNGAEVYRTGTILARQGAVEIPNSLKRPLTTLSAVTTTIDDNTSEVEVNATFRAPFDAASAGKKFLINANNYYINHQDGDAYTLGQDLNFPPTYQWIFEGNPYQGVSVKSVATGKYLWRNASNNVVAHVDNANDAKWEMDFNKVNFAGYYARPDEATSEGFTLKDVAYGQALNVNGGTKKLTFWGMVDGNSIFKADPVPDNFKEQIRTEFAALAAEVAGGLFGLTQDAYNRFKALYDASQSSTTSVPYEKYEEIKAIVDARDSYRFPETGYYRIKNATVADYYVHLNQTSLRGGGKTADAAQKDPSTIIYVEKQSNGTYRLKAAGRILAAEGNGDNKGVFAYEESTTTALSKDVNLERVVTGQGRIQFGTGSQAYLINHQNNPWTYTRTYNGHAWVFEPATSLTLPMNAVNGKSYATTCLPYAVTITTADVKAYTVAADGQTTELAGTTIPAGKPVLFQSETAATQVELTLVGTAPIAEADITPVGAFKGNFVSKPVTAQSVMTLGRSNQDPQRVGFYKFTGTVLPAFRAYFDVPTGGGAVGFDLIFGDFTTGVNTAVTTAEATDKPIYDITGRRVSQMTKGIYIIDGKKVIR